VIASASTPSRDAAGCRAHDPKLSVRVPPRRFDEGRRAGAFPESVDLAGSSAPAHYLPGVPAGNVVDVASAAAPSLELSASIAAAAPRAGLSVTGRGEVVSLVSADVCRLRNNSVPT
jgi:hypothetical protein